MANDAFGIKYLKILSGVLRNVPFISTKRSGVLRKEQDGARVSAAALTLICVSSLICLLRYQFCVGLFCEVPEAYMNKKRFPFSAFVLKPIGTWLEQVEACISLFSNCISVVLDFTLQCNLPISKAIRIIYVK